MYCHRFTGERVRDGVTPNVHGERIVSVLRITLLAKPRESLVRDEVEDCGSNASLNGMRQDVVHAACIPSGEQQIVSELLLKLRPVRSRVRAERCVDFPCECGIAQVWTVCAYSFCEP